MVVKVPEFVRYDIDYRGIAGLTVALAGFTAIPAVPRLDTSLEVVFLNIKMELYHISHNRHSHPECSIPS